MKWTNRSVIELAAIVAMTAVVVTLAILQYRWTAQISAEEQDRMVAALDTSVKKFDQEFSYDFERLCESFQIDPGGAASTLEARVARQYADWIKTTPRTEFLSGLYIWKSGGQLKPSFEALDLDNKKFEQAAWPAQLAGLQQFISVQNEKIPNEMSDRQAVYYPWTFYEETPALVRPLFGAATDEVKGTGKVRPIGFLIVQLSSSFLRRGYLPTLADRHFGQLDFGVAVRTAQPPYQAIYLSTPNFPIATASPDAEVNLFDSVAEEARRRGSPPVQSANPALQWQLVAQHPSGSLEAAVGSWRRRSLATSLGLLFILAVSLGLIFSAAHRAERLAKLQMEFVAGVSHELCTPLAVINSAVENLADGVVDNPGQVQEYVEILRDQGGRLERLLDQVLLFASDKFGGAEFALRPIEVGPVIAQSLATSEPMLRDAGFVVEKKIAEDLPAVVADPEAVNSCMENLISNAMKYAGEKQWLGVQARAVQENSHAEVQVMVEDRGIGIPASDLPHIFEPFYRVQAARDGQIRGVGLGLHLVKRMMEGMGGQVTASSEMGRGTCFVLHFPVSDADGHKNGQAA